MIHVIKEQSWQQNGWFMGVLTLAGLWVWVFSGIGGVLWWGMIVCQFVRK